MNAQEPLSAAGPALTMAAALHVLLAQHPELTAHPIRWSFEEGDGITAIIRDPHPAAGRIAELLVSELNGDVNGSEHTRSDGTPVLRRFVNAKLAGFRFFFSGDVPVEGGAE